MSVSIKKNITYNMILQVFNISFPFFTSAYISRTIGAINLGNINFGQAILAWLTIFSFFGIPTYGIREIAKNRDNKKKLQETFSELFTLQLIFSLIIICIYPFLIENFIILKSNSKLFYIFGISLIANIFNIDWFFSGIEEYKVITLRNITIKILTFILIVIFVTTKENYKYYVFLLVIGQLISNIWSFFYSKKKIELRLTINYNHLKKLKVFLFSSIVIGIYTILNSIILGFFSPSEEIAYFTRARQLQSLGQTLTLSIMTVLMPRVSYFFENDMEKYNKLLRKSLDYNYIIGIPLTIGLIMLSKELNLFLGGNEFIKAVVPLQIISPLVIIISLGMWGYLQITIPTGQEKLGLSIQIFMALLSIILSFVLIPNYGYIGASIVLLLTESSGTMLSLYLLRKKIKFILITKSLKKYILAGIVMGIGLYFISLLYTGFFSIILSVIIGALLYSLVLVLLDEKIIKELLEIGKTQFKILICKK